jgi:16S rRNA (adenine1518-N6/adenine1519-N6)-dimethyltransferase
LVQALADVSIVRMLPPTVFWPRPRVESAVVAIQPDAVKRAKVGDVAWFHEFVRRVFVHRRKYLRHVLAGLLGDQWTKTEVDTWLESQGLSGQLRAEALSVEEFLELAHALKSVSSQ